MINSTIRIPEEVWNKLKKIAFDEERSINAEIIFIIKKYLEEKK